MLCTGNLALGMASTGGRTPLSLRHGFRCVAEASVTVEDVLLAVGEQIGYEYIFSALRMNKAVVVFLNAEALVNKVIENVVGERTSHYYYPAVCTGNKGDYFERPSVYSISELLKHIF